MDRLELMGAFVRTVETGSLSAAARELKTTQPTVSKWLRALEQSVGARLLQRNTQGVHLTEVGERYYDASKRILGEVAALQTDVAGLREGLKGRLKLSFPVGLGEVHLVPMSLRFQDQHPGIELDLSLTDRAIDLVEEGTDAVVRIGTVRDPDLVARPLGSFSYVLSATPEYLAEHGTPKAPADLTGHNFLCYGYDPEEQLLNDEGELFSVPVTTNLTVNNSLALKAAIVSGRGIGRSTRWLVHDEILAGKLKVILPGLAPKPNLCHVAYLPSKFLPEKVRRWMAFIATEISKVPGWQPPAAVRGS